MIRWQQAVDQNGMPIMSGITQSDTINAMVFTGAGVKTQNVPTWTDSQGITRHASLVLITVTGGVDIFVKIGGTAAVPSGDVTDGSSSEANALGRWLNGATTISVAVGSACIVTLSYYC